MATQAIAMTARPPTTAPAITAVLLWLPPPELLLVLSLLLGLDGRDEVGVARGVETLFEGEADADAVSDEAGVGIAKRCQ